MGSAGHLDLDKNLLFGEVALRRLHSSFRVKRGPIFFFLCPLYTPAPIILQCTSHAIELLGIHSFHHLKG